MSDKNPQKFIMKTSTKVGYNAMMLALTRTMEDEERIKALLRKEGIRFVVTEVGGRSDGDFQAKITKAIIGASLNEQLIEKTQNEVHAVLHAMVEAKQGILVNVATSSNLALKAAVVRDEHWVAVALFGESSIYPLTGHERCGLGVMHI